MNRLTPDTLRRRAGIEDFNPMQQCMADSDARQMVLLSPTGSGKTLAFAVRLAADINLDPQGYTQAVIIAPSRELTVQIHEVIRPLFTPLRTVALYGGHSVTDERNSLSTPPDIIVATPGRLLDHINRNRVDLTHISALILDEYDKSLELGFEDEMKRIAAHLRRPSTIILTSATQLAEMPRFLHLDDPRIYSFGVAETPRAKTRIARVDSPERDKLETLTLLLDSLTSGRYIVFVNHREAAERIHAHLQRRHIPAGLYHGGLDQMYRQRAIDLFTNGTTPVLVATDLGARGLDINDVKGVIHYHIPSTAQAWTHRNGRTARMGADGLVYVITGPGEDFPDYVSTDYDYHPSGHSDDPIHAMAQTIYLDRGKREKISRRDILGYLTQQGGLTGAQVGAIALGDHSALIALTPEVNARKLCDTLSPIPLKGKRARLSPII